MELYKTVMNSASETQIIERSRFIAHIKPVENREEADEFIAAIKKEYKDATHNVPAMVIGDKMQIQWGSDDGEPQGTSGAPMVQMLVKEGLTNLVIVVTRYFGGIKLGTGGLVRAYTSSAKLAIEAAGICSVIEACSLTVKVDYTFLSKIQNLEGNDFRIKNIEYSDKVQMTLVTDPEKLETVEQLLRNITSGTYEKINFEKSLEKVLTD